MMPLRALVVLLAALASACASSGTVPRPFPGAVRPATPPIPNGQAIVETALALRGTPYRWGGSDPSGFDCSGFVQYVFARHGVTLPREARDQFTVGTSIKRSELREGDLVFYSTVAKGPSHVGMMIDDGQFVHAPSERGVVRVERVDVPYWDRRFVGAKRLR
jgi:cell wall-associated NlpC family hydrolase